MTVLLIVVLVVGALCVVGFRSLVRDEDVDEQ